MSLSIRARLTFWYSAVVIGVLVTFTVVASIAQRRLGIARLDAEIARLSLTLEGVMRTEFGEGLSLQASADEASGEVVAPDRSLRLQTREGRVLAEWGLRFPASFQPFPIGGAGDQIGTFDGLSGPIRVLQRAVVSGRDPYIATIGASLDPITREHREVLTALWIGTLIALVVSAAGGWLVARQTLEPLTDMARQAGEMSGAQDAARLQAPPVADELGRLAASFNALLDRISAASLVQRQFMADASHELRTPISVMQTSAQVALSREHRGEDEYREALDIVSSQSARLTRLVEEMLFLSRADAHGLPTRRDTVYFNEVVADAVASLKALGDARSVSIDVRPTQEVVLTGDEAQLLRMITNLLTNAIRHARPGGIVGVELARREGEACLRITNNGEPIPAAFQSRIFERFVSLDPNAVGAGLGLPIARWIAEAHGGRLALVSSDDAGTTFEARLPL